MSEAANYETHDCYGTRDGDTAIAPRGIRDSNGEIVLAMCRHCCRAGESQLYAAPCSNKPTTQKPMSSADELRALAHRLELNSDESMKLAVKTHAKTRELCASLHALANEKDRA